MVRLALYTATIMAAGLTQSACATQPPVKPDPVAGAVSQPFKDVGLVRSQTPPALAAATQGPYALALPMDCASMDAEIAALDAVLGPDIDAAGPKSRQVATRLFAQAIGGALGLPFRGVIRQISGAERRDQDQAHAVLAGVSRRAFLKGASRAAACANPVDKPG